eukprot:TRINITY_DN24326_c0_g1_i1.p1 TRINITY_DN24326_c0_g1~~TRINITY_DN24326_c0_g1_i1.p1  ORF type:complete len:208 (-),score=15.98 TRINITY_DN24326_c0_g1_i1:314-937(-)
MFPTNDYEYQMHGIIPTDMPMRVPYPPSLGGGPEQQALYGTYASYTGDHVPPPPAPYSSSGGWEMSGTSSSQQWDALSSNASTGSSNSSKSRRSRQRRKTTESNGGSSVPVFVPGTNRMLSCGSKNHYKGMCRPCYLNTAEMPCPAGMSCNFCHYDHDQAKLVESEAYSLKRKAERERAVEGAAADTATTFSSQPWPEPMAGTRISL